MKRNNGRYRQASVDLEAQVRRLDELVHMAHGISQGGEMPTSSPSPMAAVQRTLYDPAALVEREAWAAGLGPDNRGVVVRHLAKARRLGPSRRVAVAPDDGFLDDVARDFPHFEAVTAYIRRMAVLARRAPERIFVMSPILLAGPPGVGKTAYAQAIARRLTMPFVQVDAASMSAGFVLGGLDIGFGTGKAGLIWDALQNESMSLLVFLDEIDKAPAERSYPALSSLYALLEPVSARAFVDEAIGLPIDASWISWIATANDAERLDPPLRTRFIVFDVPQPTPEQMRQVIVSINHNLLKSAPWGASFQPELAPDVVALLQGMTPREVTQALPRAYAAAAEADRDFLVSGDIAFERTSTQRFGFV